MLAASRERAITLDALSNALKGRGFRRTPGSPRLITRLRRIKELEVGRNGTIRLVDTGEPEPYGDERGEPFAEALGPEDAGADAAPEEGGGEVAGTPRRRRRRRRGGRGRRRGGGAHSPSVAP